MSERTGVFCSMPTCEFESVTERNGKPLCALCVAAYDQGHIDGIAQMHYKDRLRAGQHVQIFEDPITMRKFEGEAVLVKRRGDNSETPGTESFLERWKVRFVSDDYITERDIAPRGASIYKA